MRERFWAKVVVATFIIVALLLVRRDLKELLQGVLHEMLVRRASTSVTP